MSSFFASSGGAGPLDWPRGSKVDPENTSHTTLQSVIARVICFGFFVLIRKIKTEKYKVAWTFERCNLEKKNKHFQSYCISKMSKALNQTKNEHSNCLWTHHGWVKKCSLLLWLPSSVGPHHPATFRNSRFTLSINSAQQTVIWPFLFFLTIFLSLPPAQLRSWVCPWKTPGELGPKSNPKDETHNQNWVCFNAHNTIAPESLLVDVSPIDIFATVQRRIDKQRWAKLRSNCRRAHEIESFPAGSFQLPHCSYHNGLQ